MKTADVTKALMARLDIAPALANSIVYPNEEVSGPAKPYLVFDDVPTLTGNNTLASGAGWGEGYLMVTVVSQLNQYDVSAKEIGDLIAERFAYGLRLGFDNGHITITRPPFVMRGFPDDTSWRTPVRINYRYQGIGAFSNTPVPDPTPGGSGIFFLASVVGGSANDIELTVPGLDFSAEEVLIAFDVAVNNTSAVVVRVNGSPPVALIGRQNNVLVQDELISPLTHIIRASTAGAKVVTGSV
jgi:hypothetical protein